jgi:phage-related protein
MNGFGATSVLEIISDYRGDTWRAVYTIRFREAVYILHEFQKRSKRGVATPSEMEVIKRRLAEADRPYRERQN